MIVRNRTVLLEPSEPVIQRRPLLAFFYSWYSAVSKTQRQVPGYGVGTDRTWLSSPRHPTKKQPVTPTLPPWLSISLAPRQRCFESSQTKTGEILAEIQQLRSTEVNSYRHFSTSKKAEYRETRRKFEQKSRTPTQIQLKCSTKLSVLYAPIAKLCQAPVKAFRGCMEKWPRRPQYATSNWIPVRLQLLPQEGTYKRDIQLHSTSKYHSW